MTTAQDASTENYWHGKSAVVTGGARGQGASIARMLLKAGAHVLVMDRLPTDDPAWQDLRNSAADQRGTLVCLELDFPAEGRALRGHFSPAGTGTVR